VDVSETASISSGIAARYASAVFDLAKDGKAIAKLETNVDDLAAALDSSAEMRDLISSPVYSRDVQDAAINAISKK